MNFKPWIPKISGLFFSLFITFFSFGQAETFPLKFQESSFDFGVFGELGGLVYHQFEFINTSKDTIWVLDAKPECHCTTGEFPKTGVAPNGKGNIKVTYDPKGRPWDFESGVLVSVKGRKDPLGLKIKGKTIGGAETIRFAPAEYLQKFQYNEKSIEGEEAEFKKFVNSLVPLLEKHKEIKIQIESSASHVPTKTFSDNGELTKQRAKAAREKVLDILAGWKADLSRVVFLDDLTLVQGPAYTADYKKHMAKYLPYQYVKIRVF